MASSSLFEEVDIPDVNSDVWDMSLSFAAEPFDYQWDTINETIDLLSRHRSVLVPLATGMGKTVIASELIGRRNKSLGRCLFLAAEKVLINQAEAAIREHTGLHPAVEQAKRRDSRFPEHRRQVLVASVPSLVRRLHHFSREEFSLILCDEAHGATSAQWLAVLQHFHKAQVVGLTATPIRPDGVGLENVFEAACKMRDITFGQERGYLVPTEHYRAIVEGLDLSRVHTGSNGDFNEKELSRAYESGSGADVAKRLHSVALTIATKTTGLQGVTFMQSVDMAKRLANVLTSDYGISSECIHGELDETTRDKHLAAFDAGNLQSLVAFGCLTQGWNSWRVGYVGLGRPVASHLRMTQMCGRGTRVHGPSVFTPGHTVESRKAAIASSPKPKCLIINFHGKNNPKQLSSLDILSGDPIPDDVREAMLKILDRQPVEATEAMKEAMKVAKQARDEKSARKAAWDAKHMPTGMIASGQVELLRSEDADQRVISEPGFSTAVHGGCDDWQISMLVRLGVKEDRAIAMSRKQAYAVIASLKKKTGLEYRVTWGEYAGKKLAEIPPSYISKVEKMHRSPRVEELLKNWHLQ